MIDVFLGAVVIVLYIVFLIAAVYAIAAIDDWRLSRYDTELIWREFQREDAERVRQKIEAANKFRLGRKE